MLSPDDLTDVLRDLVAGKITSACLNQQASSEPSTSPAVVFPGAFSPRHRGHQQMAAIAEQLLGQTVQHELSIVNVDKPPLDAADVRRRLSHFRPTEPVWLTRSATFVEKAALFPNATFVVGVDTIIRIADPRYYGGRRDARDAAVEELEQLGCRFLVFGRLLTDQFMVLDNCELPETLLRNCQYVSEEQFRIDLSSTQLRGELPG